MVGPAKVEFQSFVREQTHLGQHCARKRPDVGHIMSFCISRAEFRPRHISNRVSFIPKVAFLCGNFDAKFQFV